MNISIIGVGHVGTSAAVSILHSGLAHEVLLHDIDPARAEGEAMDLAHGAPYYPATSIRSCSIEDAVTADIVIFAAGRNGQPGESRLHLLKDNVRVATDVGKQLSNSKGIVIVVSNPVDILTKTITQVSSLPPQKVMGTGTMLDTARLRQRLALRLEVDPRSIHAYVIGEHGDSEIVLWSSARIGSRALRGWPSWTRNDEVQISDEVRRAAYEIISRKGVTNHAIGLVTADLVRSIVRNEKRILTVSRLQPTSSNVSFSLPAVVGSSGAAQVIMPELDEQEADALEKSIEILRRAEQGITDSR